MKIRISMILLMILFALVSINAEAQHDKYFFRTIEGRAVLSRTGGSTWLALQQVQPIELKPGDIVNVEGDGRGELTFPDGTLVRMKNNAMVTLMRYGINLRLGNVWLNVRRSSDMFKVITPLGSCSVLGTSFDVDVDRFGKTLVRVFSGIVAVRAVADARNRQLVLQPGMRTMVSDNSKVADKPEKFQGSTIETSLISEWESRSMVNQSSPSEFKLIGRSQATPPAMQPAAPAIIMPPPALPPIRPEIQTGQMDLPPVNEIVEGIKPVIAEGKTVIIARQRSDFLEMLRQQKLARDSVIGGRFEPEDEMRKEQHGSELGQNNRLTFNIRDDASLSREYYNLRNRLLRVQSQIRQTELQVAAMVAQNISTSAQRRKISSSQALLLDLQGEHRTLVTRLRDIQTKK